LVGRTEHTLQEAARKLGPQAVAIAHDITELDRASESISTAEIRVGSPVSIWVNNAGIHLKKNVMAYSTAKTALIGMMRKALDGDPARRDKILARTPIGRFGEADDIGWAAVYLCSPAARFVTGITRPVDGGVHMGF
jgi:NAD(P)-dependent dehydrogenase (short-subunit alcohol dehydrogenase family)